MNKTRLRIKPVFLILALFFAILGIVLILCTKQSTRTDYYQTQLDASFRMQEALDCLKTAILDEGIPMEEEDINQTALLGPDWTEITTTLGHPSDKRSILNPNCAALLVKYFKQAGLKAGDTIAVGTSGSFPGFAIATLCAATEMQLKTKVIASYGSSMHGGNRLEFPTIKMIKTLLEKGIVDFDLLAVSPGSDNDYGKGGLEGLLYEGSRDIVVALGKAEGVEFIDYNNLEKSIARRLELYGDDIDCFINIGGASPNSGTTSYTLDFPEGLVTDPPRIPTSANRGLSYEYAAQGIPVINLLYIKKLLNDNGLPYDPVPLPQPGSGDVYYETSYSVFLIILTLILVLGTLVSGIILQRRHGHSVLQ